MKAIYTSPDSRLQFEFDAPNVKGAFETLAQLQEVFEEPCCGKCQSKQIRCDVRTPQTFTYYQLVCLDCHARLDFGQNKDQVKLFAKRHDKNGQEMAYRGWYIYAGEDTDPHDRTKYTPRGNQPSTITGNGGNKSSEVLGRYARDFRAATDLDGINRLRDTLNTSGDKQYLNGADANALREVIATEIDRVGSDIPF